MSDLRNSCSSISSTHLPGEIAANYEDKNKKLGEGGFAKVLLAEHIPTGQKVAIKIMNKEHLKRMGDLHRAYREINAMKKLNHQHICQLYQVYETDEDIFMVLEHLPGGELFDYIVAKEKLSILVAQCQIVLYEREACPCDQSVSDWEDEARRFFRQIISAVAYMHDKGLAHRDLKPENMLLDEVNNVKLIDFGLASDPEAGLVMPLATCCGSPAYAAPELVSGKEYFGSAADIWSLGVVLYGLLCGFLPFDVDSEDETYLLYQKIKSGQYEVPEWLSPGSIRILRKLLETDPTKRINIKELLNEDWLNEGYGGGIQWQGIIKRDKPDVHIIDELAEFYGLSMYEMEKRVKEYKFDSLTAHYFLLWKLRRKTPRPKLSNKDPECEYLKPIENLMNNEDEELFGKWTLPPHKTRRERAMTYCGNEDDKENSFIEENDKSYSPLHESRDKSSSVFEGFCMLGVCTPARQNTMSGVQKTPIPIGLATPRFAKKLKEKVAHLMTPRKSSSNGDEPRKVKAIYKVNSTSTKTAPEVRSELNRVLSHLRCRGKLHSVDNSDSYLFRCKGDDDKGNKLAFELEICSVPGLENLVGIRHKRLKGDAWAYKRMCDTILNIAKI